MPENKINVLWWGRSDLEYSRNRIIRQCLVDCGFGIKDFSPRFSMFADIEARFSSLESVDLIWVPCFRQRDLSAAVRWSKRKSIPVVFDPLISAYDKQVYERKKFSAASLRAKKLLSWEQELFLSASLVLADTWEHARFFQNVLGVDARKLAVVPVGAEEELFKPAASVGENSNTTTVLFYGSFLNLQGPEIIIEAARLCQGPEVFWKMVGQGPLLDDCRKLAAGVKNIEFQDWVTYEELPGVIHSADILLGIFGTSAKAARVIPNKVYQALACGKPLVTRRSPAYPETFENNNQLGISWVEPGSPQELAEQVEILVSEFKSLESIGKLARNTYDDYFSMISITASLTSALQPLLLNTKRV